jgi:hypothetical protein
MFKRKTNTTDANRYLRVYFEAKEQRDRQEQVMKTQKALLEKYADEHANDFEGNICTLDEGRLVIKKAKKVLLGEGFDMDTFQSHYPTAVKREVTVSGLKSVFAAVPKAAQTFDLSLVDGKPTLSLEPKK